MFHQHRMTASATARRVDHRADRSGVDDNAALDGSKPNAQRRQPPRVRDGTRTARGSVDRTQHHFMRPLLVQHPSQERIRRRYANRQSRGIFHDRLDRRSQHPPRRNLVRQIAFDAQPGIARTPPSFADRPKFGGMDQEPDPESNPITAGQRDRKRRARERFRPAALEATPNCPYPSHSSTRPARAPAGTRATPVLAA